MSGVLRICAAQVDDRGVCRRLAKALVRYGLVVALWTAAPSVLAQAEQTEETTPLESIVTDRPTDSASPLLVPRHAFQLELGYRLSQVDTVPESTEVHLFPDLLARYGMNRRFEARLVAGGWSFKSGGPPQGEGFSDISIGTKIALAEERGRRPQMALLVDLSLPVGARGVTSDYVIPKILFLGSNALTDRLALTYNVGPSFVTAETDGEKGTNTDLNYAVSLSASVGGPFSLFGEFFGALAFGSSLPDRHNFQLGTTILLNPSLQIDFRAGTGLVENEPDWLIGAGLAFRLPN